MDVPFLGRVDLDPAVRAAGDAGLPVLFSDPQSASAQAFRAIASNLAAQINILRYEQDRKE